MINIIFIFHFLKDFHLQYVKSFAWLFKNSEYVIPGCHLEFKVGTPYSIPTFISKSSNDLPSGTDNISSNLGWTKITKVFLDKLLESYGFITQWGIAFINPPEIIYSNSPA